MENRQQVTVADNKAFPQLVPPTKEKLLLYLEIIGVAKLMTQHEKDYFIETAQAYCLNPFKREIHCVPRWVGNKQIFSVITGYDVYIKRAERTGKLDGYTSITEGTAPTLKGVIKIYRKDWSHPFEHEVDFNEIVQRKKDGTINSTWNKMPKFMTKKVAIAQGFRLCFPDELGGMPYTADELPQEEKEEEVVATVVEEPAKEQPKELGKALTDRQRALITNAKTPAELRKQCRRLFTSFPTAKKELTNLYNKRLEELQKGKENTEVTND